VLLHSPLFGLHEARAWRKVGAHHGRTAAPMTGPQLSSAFFVQMCFILAMCRGVGWMSRKLGQPQVVGEMIAGVFMGPSLLGLLWPGMQHALFPPESLKVLYIGAQLGVGLYMFLV